MPSSEYIRTDTAEDAVASLELAATFLLSAAKDSRYWKWSVVALHSGLQGLFALSLEGGDGLLVQKPGVTRAMLAAHEAGTTQPEAHMDNFMRLYRKVQDKGNLRSSSALPVPSSPTQDVAIESFDRLRDDFLHFNVKSWSIERHLLNDRIASCLVVAEFLLSQSQAILWHEDSHPTRARAALEAVRRYLPSGS